MTDLENFKQVRPGNARDLEQLADILVIVIINLKEAGHTHKFGDVSLYNKLQQKLSEFLLARYHRWVFESSMSEGVATLRKWVIQEAEYQTIAADTMHSLKRKEDSQQPVKSFQRSRNQRTFFGEDQKDRTVDIMPCQACNTPHAIRRCQTLRRRVQLSDGELQSVLRCSIGVCHSDIMEINVQTVGHTESIGVKNFTTGYYIKPV